MLTGLDAEVAADLAIVSRLYISRGGASLKNFTENLVNEFEEGARPYAEQIYEDSVDLYDQAHGSKPKVVTP
jgi:hypothetical protein